MITKVPDGSPAVTASLLRELRRALTPPGGIHAVIAHARSASIRQSPPIPREEVDDDDIEIIEVDDSEEREVQTRQGHPWRE
jgi:hypothetical protein